MRLRLLGPDAAPSDRQKAAETLLKTASSLLFWAMRDAVPFFDHASFRLAADDIGGADEVLKKDKLDDYVATLWPELSIDTLRWGPLLSDDPSELRVFDDVIRGRSRAELVAHWLWDTYRSVVVETDAAGKFLGGNASGGDSE